MKYYIRGIGFILAVMLSANIHANTTEKPENVKFSACQDKECIKQFKQIRKLAKNGSPDAQGILSAMYFNGYGISQSSSRGISWLKKAARNGGSLYRNKLGLMYLSGDLVEKDVEKGVSWLQQSADNQNEQALYILGAMYANGSYVTKDITKANKYLLQASMLGDDKAMVLLGHLYEEGVYGEGMIAQAIEFYKAAAQRENGYAEEQLLRLLPTEYKVKEKDPNIETITVRAPKVSDLVNDLIANLHNQGLFTGRGTTGSRVSGRSCVVTGECKVVGAATDISRSLFYSGINATFSRISAPPGG